MLTCSRNLLLTTILAALLLRGTLSTPFLSSVEDKPPSSCEYTTLHGAKLANTFFPLLVNHAPNVEACRNSCTRASTCGNAEFHLPKNSSDLNCGFYQQEHYEPPMTSKASASHVVLAIKRNSCSKRTAKRVPLDCKPGPIKLFKGSDCLYNVTCGVTLPPQLSGKVGQTISFGAAGNVNQCAKTVGLQPLSSKRGESLSFTEGGFCIEVQSRHFVKEPTRPNKAGLVYQIVKNSCNKPAARPRKGKGDTVDGSGKVITKFARAS